MEYPNIEYILTYGTKKKDDGVYGRGVFLAKKQAIVKGEVTGIVILPSSNPISVLDGMNLDIREKYVKNTQTNKIYNWSDLNIGIENDSIYLITKNSRTTPPTKLWKLPQMLFNYLEVKYCFIYSIVMTKGELCIQMIKYRTTLNNTNQIIWSKPVIIPEHEVHEDIIKTYIHDDGISLSLPKIRSTANLDENKYKKVLDSIYFKIKSNKIYLKDIELIRQDNNLLIISKLIDKEGHILGFIDITGLDMGDTIQ